MVDLDDDVLMPLQELPEVHQAFVLHRIAQKARCQVLFPVQRKIPGGGSFAWTIIRRVKALEADLFAALVDDLIADDVLSSVQDDGVSFSKQAAAVSGSEAPVAGPPREGKPAVPEAELALIEHFLGTQGALLDIDFIVLGCRKVSLAQQLGQYPIRAIKAALRQPMTNPEATISSIAKKASGVREIEEVPGTSPKAYRLTPAGEARVRALLSLVPAAAHDLSNTQDHADETPAQTPQE